MNEIYTFCGVAVCLACFGAVLKQLKPEFLPIYSAACAIVCGGYLLLLVTPIVKYIYELTESTALPQFFALLIKALGVSMLCGVAADVCRACGEATLANGVETAGRALIILLSLPVVSFILKTAIGLIG